MNFTLKKTFKPVYDDGNGVPIQCINLNAALGNELAGDLRVDGRSHARFMEMMDRVYMSEYLQQTGTVAEKAGQLATFSHSPNAQPFSPTTRT